MDPWHPDIRMTSVECREDLRLRDYASILGWTIHPESTDPGASVQFKLDDVTLWVIIVRSPSGGGLVWQAARRCEFGPNNKPLRRQYQHSFEGLADALETELRLYNARIKS